MDWINSLYLKVESRKLELEQANKTLQTLFKAWPHPNDEKKASDNPGDQQTKDPNVAGLGAAPDLTAEEQEGVSLVNQLLQKAQKARAVQKKIEEPKRSTTLRETEHRSTDIKDKRNLQNEKSLTSKNGMVKVTGENEQTMVSRSDHSQCNKNIPTKPITKVSNKSNQSKKSASSVTHKDPDTKPTSVKPSLGKGATKEGYVVTKSAGRRVTPAHVSAPFQTNPRLTSAKLKTEYRSSTGKVLSASQRNSTAQSSRVKGNYSAPLKRPTSKEAVNKSTVSYKPFPQKQTSENLNNSGHSDCSSDSASADLNMVDNASCDTSSALSLHTDEYTSSHLGQQGTKSDNCGDSVSVGNVKDIKNEGSGYNQLDSAEKGPSQGEQGFRLSKDGNSLSLPGKLRKLGGINRKLRERIYTQNVTKKVDSPQPFKAFSAMLHNTFEDEEILRVQMAARQAEYLVNVYRNLTGMLENLYLPNLNVDSPIEHVLLAKKSLEYILTAFHETENHSRSINLGILRSICGNDGGHKQKIATPTSRSMRIWYPRTEMDFSQHRTLKYKSYKQLERYTSLVHRAQWLQLQIDSMDILAEQSLPLLKSLQPSSSEFVQVLRCCYSMLSTNPNRVPVIVRDMQDEPDCDDQEPGSS